MEIPNADPKYFVFKRSEFFEMMGGFLPKGDVDCAPIAQDMVSAAELYRIDDAVVIRRQDIFAPPALDAYANSMRIVLEGMDPGDMRRSNLQKVADYFAGEAAEAWLNHDRKLPD